MSIALTSGGEPVACDGCGAYVERVTEDMKHSVPDAIGLKNYGRTGLIYVVCAPLPDGTQPCLVLAQTAEELYDRVRCRISDCDGTRCAGNLW